MFVLHRYYHGLANALSVPHEMQAKAQDLFLSSIKVKLFLQTDKSDPFIFSAQESLLDICFKFVYKPLLYSSITVPFESWALLSFFEGTCFG
jgi:hypothetical protein